MNKRIKSRQIILRELKKHSGWVKASEILVEGTFSEDLQSLVAEGIIESRTPSQCMGLNSLVKLHEI